MRRSGELRKEAATQGGRTALARRIPPKEKKKKH
jgi:hypothetical protein